MVAHDMQASLVKVSFAIFAPAYIQTITSTGAGVTETQKGFLIFAAVIVILTCIFYLLLEVYQVYRRGPRKYFTSILNYFQSITYLCVIVFVFPAGHVCWCYPSWKWQIGALAIFLAWMNNFVLLKDIPHIGKPITMLFNVYVNFMLLVYLPILLILTFAFPFYMLFIITLQVRCGNACTYNTSCIALQSVLE